MSEHPHGVIFIGAHPDDETVMAGGTLAMLHAQGVPTHVVCVTDGRGGDSSGVPGADTPDALARMRADELRCSVAALGVLSLTQFDYEDPVMGPDAQPFGFAADEEKLAAQIAAAIRAAQADIVLTHGSDGEYGHPAHAQVHRIVLRAVREHTPDVVLYGVAAFVPTIDDRIWNRSDPAHFALDTTPWIEAKEASMRCHRTQYVSFTRRRNLKTLREALRPVEAFHRHWPASDAPDDSFAALLRRVGAWVPDHAG
jgi:LmbE family N-acetylglucosaminyl deacetylase